jgi:hypothetical protein
MEAQRYQVTQDDQDYIVSVAVIGDKITLECQDNNLPSTPIYGKDYTLYELRSYSKIFNYTQSVMDVENEITNAIENHKVSISNQGNIIEIIFDFEYNSISQELTFQLPLQTENPIENNAITPMAPMESQPIYKDINFPNYQTPVVVQEDDYPDCTYSTKGQVLYQPVVGTQIGCGCPMDHDRIDKIEIDTNFMRNEHERLRQRLNDLKTNIHLIKKKTNEIRTENGILNMKTLELKKQYKDLLEAESYLIAENDELRKENHELVLRKNELGFYIVDHHDHDNVREVNIPLEHKSRRPTNVSKREKKLGGGYTSSSNNNYGQNSLDQPYSSANLGSMNKNFY